VAALDFCFNYGIRRRDHAAATQRRWSACGRAHGANDERLPDGRFIDRAMSHSREADNLCAPQERRRSLPRRGQTRKGRQRSCREKAQAEAGASREPEPRLLSARACPPTSRAHALPGQLYASKRHRSRMTPRARFGLTESRGIPKGARVRFKLLGGFEASWDGSSLFFGSAGAGGRGGGFGPDLPVGSQDVHGQRRQRREVVAAPAPLAVRRR
jgi:hypothetical protein